MNKRDSFILKKLAWIGTTRGDLKELPSEVQDEMGYALHQVQAGFFPDNAKPLKGFRGVFEIRSDFDKNTYRTVYAIKLGEYIYVLHVFQKKSTQGIKTPQQEIELIKRRLQIAQAFAREE